MTMYMNSYARWDTALNKANKPKKKQPIYSIQTCKFDTEEQARREFLNIYSQLRYAHDTQLKKHGKEKDFEELSAVMCISKYNGGFVDKTIVPASAKGGHKYEITRSKLFYRFPFPHETDLHLHIYCVGTGARTITNKIKAMKNQKYGNGKWTVRTRERSAGLPYNYVFDQAISNGFRTVGNPRKYPERE